MTPKWLTRLVRRNVTSVRLYGLLRTAMLAFQWLAHRPDESDLRLLERLPSRDGELILDIGANGGQSAVALSFIRPRARIISYEPIPALWPELERVRTLLGRRFDFRKWALGEEAGAFSLYIPVSGELAMTTRASISQEAAARNCRELETAVGLPTRIERSLVEVREGDAENLAPSIIKIDVEGAEHQVVCGLKNTIAAHRPVVILEKSESFERCVALFDAWGYEILTSDAASAAAKHLSDISDRNWIACPPEMSPYFLRAVAG